MKIALLNPAIWLGKNSLHPYVGELILNHKPYLYFNDMKYFGAFCYRFQKEYGIKKFIEQVPRFLFGIRNLNDKADALLCFNGAPEKKLGAPVPEFSGIQIFHVMDYFRNSREQSRILQEGGVKTVFGYGDHYKHDAFFRKYYPQYKDRIIPVAFSYGERFYNYTPFEERYSKCVAVGAIAPFVDKKSLELGRLESKDMGYEAEEFFHPIKIIQPDRKLLIDNENKMSDILDSFLPGTRIKNTYIPTSGIVDKSWVPKNAKTMQLTGRKWDYNIVDVFNRYKTFTHGETVFNVVWAKSFEGCASGSVLICADEEWNREFGFEGGVNCLFYKKGDLASIRRAVEWANMNDNELKTIAEQGMALVRTRYSPVRVARDLITATSECLR